jgi:hypothetical protein
MPAQAGARYIRRERVATLQSVEAGWVALWRQVDPLPVESKAELQSLIESYLRRNQPKPAAPPSAVVKGRGSGTGTVSLGEAVQPALLRRVERYFETGRGKTCEIDRVAWVCPVKAGVFSGRQTHRGKSQKPRSLDSRKEGN